MKYQVAVLGLLFATFTFVGASSPAGGHGYYGGYHPQQPQQHQGGYYQQPGQYGGQPQQNYQPQTQGATNGQQAAESQNVEFTPTESKEKDEAVDSDLNALSEPWQEHIDPSSGRPYYYNPETSVTQWERPESPATPDVPTNIMSPQSQMGTDASVRNVEPAADYTQGETDMIPVIGGATEGSLENAKPTEEQPATDANAAPQADNTMDPFPNAFAAGNNLVNPAVTQEKEEVTVTPTHSFTTLGQTSPGNHQPDNNALTGQQPMQYGGQEMPGQQPWGTQQRLVQPWRESSGPQQAQTEKPAETKASIPTPDQPAFQQSGPQMPSQPPLQQQSTPGMSQQSNYPQQMRRSPPQQQGFQRPPNQWQNNQLPPNYQQTPPGQPTQPPQERQGGPLQERQGGPPQERQGGPPQYAGTRAGPYGMPPQQRGPLNGGFPPQQHSYPRQQQHPYPGQQPPQYLGQQPPYPYNYGASPQQGPGAGQLVQQHTDELSSTVREKWGQALGGLGVFGNRTKELAETTRNQIGESASYAGKAIGDTSTGIWGRFRSGLDTVKSTVFERSTPQNQLGGQGYSLSNYGVPPPRSGPPGYPPTYSGQHPVPQGYPPRMGPGGQQAPSGYQPRPMGSAPYAHPSGQGQNAQQNQSPPMQSQYGRPPVQQSPQQGRPPMRPPMQGQQQGQPQNYPPRQFPPQNYPPPRQQQQAGPHNPADHPAWNQ